MKRIALTFATFAMLTAGSLAIGAGPMGAAEAATLSRQAAQHGPYAAARGPNASETTPSEQARSASIPYDADGPAYFPGQNRTTDFQLQH